jgi:hypothetical protein
MPAPGFPSENPRRNRSNSVRPPVSGTLMEYLEWAFPTVYKQVKRTPKDGMRDFKSTDYATQHPSQTGRVP